MPALLLPAAHTRVDSPVDSFRRRHGALLAVIGLVSLRAAYLPWINLFPEEAYYWNYSQHLDLSYLDHPPMVAWLIHLGVRCFGHHEIGVRAPAVACSLVTSFFAFRLTSRWYGPHAGWVAAALAQLLPFFFMAGWMMTPDAPLTACWAGMLFFLARVVFDGDGRAWWGVGVCLGVGMLSKYTIALLGPATLLFLALDPPSRVWFRRLAPYGSVLLAVGIFSPVIFWNALHHWESFAFQSTGRMHASRRFALPGLLGSALLILTPMGVWIAVRGLGVRRDEPTIETRRRLFVRVFTLVPLSVFVLFSLTHHVKLNWTGPLWLAVVPGLAVSWNAPGRWQRTGWRMTVIVLVLGYTGLLQSLRTGLPGMAYASNTALFPVGWPEMTHSLERQKQALRESGTARVLIVGMDHDFIASEAAFYQRDRSAAVRETTAVHLFEGHSLMYAYWFPTREQDGANLLLVGFKRNELKSESIHRRCESLGPIEEQTVRVDGFPVRTYYTRVAYGYLSSGYRRSR